MVRKSQQKKQFGDELDQNLTPRRCEFNNTQTFNPNKESEIKDRSRKKKSDKLLAFGSSSTPSGNLPRGSKK